MTTENRQDGIFAVANIASVAILTKNRTIAFTRCLETLLLNCATHGRSPRIIVIDSSTSQDILAANQLAIQRCIKSRTNQPPIDYIGPKQIAKLILDLSRLTGIVKSDVAFVLAGVPEIPINTGASRNVHLLSTQGELTLTLDDDIVGKICTRKAAPVRPKSAAVRRSRNTFYVDHETLESAIEYEQQDLLAIHESVLGKTVESCSNSLSGKLGVEGYELVKPETRVVASVSGVAGNITSESPIQSYYGALMTGTCTPSSLAEHHKMLEAGQTIRLAEEYILGKYLVISGYCLGLDNTEPLPPWLPALRSQDKVFGRILRAVRHDAIACLLPWAVIHGRPEGRSFARSAIVDRFRCPTGGELIAAITEKFYSETRSKTPSLELLGDYLVEFASGDASTFQTKVGAISFEMIRQRTRFLQSVLLETLEFPPYMQEEIQQMIAAMVSSLKTQDHNSILDLNVLGKRPHESLQEITHQYGKTIKYWKQLTEASVRLGSAH